MPKTNHLSPYVPDDIYELYDVRSYRNAAEVLATACKPEFDELMESLRNFKLTLDHIRKPGGNESEIPKLVSALLRPKDWYETHIHGDLDITLTIHYGDGRPAEEKKVPQKGVLDGHKIDYVKQRVAFDLEWNSKDQTFDRDLYAFRAFYDANVISAGVLMTRGVELGKVFDKLGAELDDTGSPVLFPRGPYKGKPKPLKAKYGASTTYMPQLTRRLDSGRNGGCPVLAIGITEKLITDWEAYVEANP